MLITSLLVLATGKIDVDSVVKRYDAFMAAHPVLSVDCALSGWGGAGTGTMIVHRAGNETKADWTAKFAHYVFRFVTNGKIGIDIDRPSQLYDRVSIDRGPQPNGRVRTVFGYPYPIAFGRLPFEQAERLTKVSTHGADTELVLLARSPEGDTMITGDFGPDGRLDSYDLALGRDNHWQHERVVFTNYRFGSAALVSTFDVDPPVGFSPYAFDRPPHALETDRAIPPVPVQGHGKTDLAVISKHGVTLIAFVDDPLPAGLLSSLKHLNRTLHVVAVGLPGSRLVLGGLPLYRATEAGFDRAGVMDTPQFYLVRDGKLLQAWSGFKAAAAGTFEHEIEQRAVARGATY